MKLERLRTREDLNYQVVGVARKVPAGGFAQICVPKLRKASVMGARRLSLRKFCHLRRSSLVATSHK